MNVLETEWWTVAVPPEWWAESEEESILIGDRDGVGCIQISTLHRTSGEFDASEVENIARRESPGAATWQCVSPGDFVGLNSRHAEEGTALREWYVARGGMLLYITYSCDDENRGMDDAAVDEILDTLTVVAA